MVALATMIGYVFDNAVYFVVDLSYLNVSLARPTTYLCDRSDAIMYMAEYYANRPLSEDILEYLPNLDYVNNPCTSVTFLRFSS